MRIVIHARPSLTNDRILLGAELDLEDGSAPKNLTPILVDGTPVYLDPDSTRRNYDYMFERIFDALQEELRHPTTMAKILFPEGFPDAP